VDVTWSPPDRVVVSWEAGPVGDVVADAVVAAVASAESGRAMLLASRAMRACEHVHGADEVHSGSCGDHEHGHSHDAAPTSARGRRLAITDVAGDGAADDADALAQWAPPPLQRGAEGVVRSLVEWATAQVGEGSVTVATPPAGAAGDTIIAVKYAVTPAAAPVTATAIATATALPGTGHSDGISATFRITVDAAGRAAVERVGGSLLASVAAGSTWGGGAVLERMVRQCVAAVAGAAWTPPLAGVPAAGTAAADITRGAAATDVLLVQGDAAHAGAGGGGGAGAVGPGAVSND